MFSYFRGGTVHQISPKRSQIEAYMLFIKNQSKIDPKNNFMFHESILKFIEIDNYFFET